MVKLLLSGYTIYLRLLAIKGCDAIQPGFNCFISMIISVVSRSGLQPLLELEVGLCIMKQQAGSKV